MGRPLIDLMGQRFGRLLVVGKELDERGVCLGWVCRCDCGREVTALGGNLTGGRKRSCGCLQRRPQAKHGLYNTREYKIWIGLRGRCNNPKNSGFKWYGAKGITVCPEWEASFETFLADMGKAPSPKHSIDRIDYNKGYFKENCRWATHAEQARNKRNNRLVTFNGETKPLIDWVEGDSPKYSLTMGRLVNGWAAEDALLTPSRGHKRMITFDGKSQCLSKWAEDLGLPLSTLANRLSRGWPLCRALAK